jgi:RNA polymerase sigma factor (sigma-70 family)
MTMTMAASNQDDAELLRRSHGPQGEDAFAELVRRHIRLVHNAALRQVGGDDAAAADVTQLVFAQLARRAFILARHPAWIGWLHTTTRRIATHHIRSEARRKQRELGAHVESARLNGPPAPDPEWARLRPVLDEALNELADADRVTILLRHFEQRPFSEIGSRLGVTEDAARVRTSRALERLRVRLAKRGITSSAAALGLALESEAAVVVPPAVVAAVTASVSLPAAAPGAGAFSLIAIMTTTHLKTAAVTLALAGAITAVMVQHREASRWRADYASLEARLARSGAETDTIRDTVAAQEKELARLRGEQSELVRLRGEVARLRRAAAASAATLSAPSQKASATPSAPAPTDPGEPAFAIQASVPAGQSLVTGGWTNPAGQRAMIIITPTVEAGDTGANVKVNSLLLALTEEATAAPEIAKYLAASAAGTPPQNLADAASVNALVELLKSFKGANVSPGPSVIGASGDQARMGLAEPGQPLATTFEFLPKAAANGSIDLGLKIGFEAPPPRDPAPAKPAPTDKP